MKNVLINGADGGLGEALVILFSKSGYHVTAITYKSLKGKHLIELPNVEIYLVDGFLDWEYRAQTIQTIVENLPAIDVLINNVGHSLFGAFEIMSDNDIQHHFQSSVFDLMRMTCVMIPKFRERHGGTLVNISSIAGLLAVPLDSLFHATEFAVEGFTESLAFELAPFGIKVRLVEPGGDLLQLL